MCVCVVEREREREIERWREEMSLAMNNVIIENAAIQSVLLAVVSISIDFISSDKMAVCQSLFSFHFNL